MGKTCRIFFTIKFEECSDSFTYPANSMHTRRCDSHIHLFRTHSLFYMSYVRNDESRTHYQVCYFTYKKRTLLCSPTHFRAGDRLHFCVAYEIILSAQEFSLGICLPSKNGTIVSCRYQCLNEPPETHNFGAFYTTFFRSR